MAILTGRATEENKVLWAYYKASQEFLTAMDDCRASGMWGNRRDRAKAAERALEVAEREVKELGNV